MNFGLFKTTVLRCFSLAPYYPKNRGDPTDKALRGIREVVYGLKDGRTVTDGKQSLDPAELVASLASNVVPQEFRGRLAVPVPRSTVTQSPSAQGWPAHALAAALVKQGIASQVWPCLVRHTAVKRASQAARGERTTVQEHVATMRATLASNMRHEPILLVDDVLTRGTQLVAAVEILRAAGHTGEIAAFTCAHTTQDATDTQQNRIFRVVWVHVNSYADREDT